jgi:hypothetical protein
MLHSVAQWVDTVLDVLDACLESYSPGSFELRFSPEECQLIIAPALAEMVGGAEDGEEVYAPFSLHLAELVKAFDALPEMSWYTMHDELHMEGEIDGEDVWIILQKFPFKDDEKPRWLIEEGVLRRRNDSE